MTQTLAGPSKQATHSQQKEPMILYQVFPFQLNAHCFTVTCYVPKPNPKGQTFSLPAWIPGSYRIRDFAKHIIEISAESKGKKVPLIKLDKRTWKVDRCSGPLTLSYRVYARDRSVRGAWLDFTKGFFNGACLFLRVDGQEKSPIHIDIYRPLEEPTRSWNLATMLRRVDDLVNGFGRYEAPNYEVLIDSPVMMGNFQMGAFDAYGIVHKIVIVGCHEEIDMAKLVADCRRICETQMAFFGSPYPVSEYLFMIQVGQDGISGLEHSHCCALQCGRDNLPIKNRKTSSRYLSLLRLISHEYFHLWLVKRIRPIELCDADLGSEAYTRQLWIFEGVTAYYEDLMLLRARLLTENEFLLLIGRNLFDLQAAAGRKIQSVADSSFDAWIKFYQMEEASPHAVVNYYIKGALIAMTLDLWIRDKTSGRFSLDDVMRALWQRYGAEGKPVAEGDFEALAEEITGCTLKTHINKWVRGVEELPLPALLKRFGIEVTESHSPLPNMGMKLIEESHLLKIRTIEENGPAQQAGLITGDLIVAIGGRMMNHQKLAQWLETIHPDEAVSVTFFRDDLLHHTVITLGPPAIEHIHLTIMTHRRRPRAQLLRTGWFFPSFGQRPISFS